MTGAFKECPKCSRRWPRRSALLADPEVTLVGYQVSGLESEAGFFLFNHLTADCGTTMTVPAAAFADLHEGPLFTARLRGTEECPGYCLRQSELEACTAPCECRSVRDVLQVLRVWPKHPHRPGGDTQGWVSPTGAAKGGR